MIRLWPGALAAVVLLASASARADGLIEHSWRSFWGDPVEPGKPSLLVYPTLAFTPETSWEIGLSSVYVYQAEEKLTNRLSELSMFGFYTLESQYGILFNHALYTDENRWFALGEGYYRNFPLLYHGLGMDTPKEPIALVEGRGVLVRERLLRKVRPSLYAGAEFIFDSLTQTRFEWEGPEQALPRGGSGSTNLLVGAGVVYDSLHNALNPREGGFFEIATLAAKRGIGSNFSFGEVFSDNRYFIPVNRRDVLAMQLVGQFTYGSVPFDQLALLGGEHLMRGYYLGRFRDNNLIAGQVEYRMLPLKPFRRWGASAFASAGTVFRRLSGLTSTRVLPAGGLGLRFLLFPDKDVWSRFDFAVTEEGTGIYLFIGEAF